MNLLQISKLAARTVVNMALEGKLELGHLWTAFKGGGTYLTAIAAGDIASPAEAQRRVAICDSCPNCVYEEKKNLKDKNGRRVVAIALYCGPPLDPNPAPGVCSCLVGCRANGVLTPGAKTHVASQECPSGKWGRAKVCE